MKPSLRDGRDVCIIHIAFIRKSHTTDDIVTAFSCRNWGRRAWAWLGVVRTARHHSPPRAVDELAPLGLVSSGWGDPHSVRHKQVYGNKVDAAVLLVDQDEECCGKRRRMQIAIDDGMKLADWLGCSTAPTALGAAILNTTHVVPHPLGYLHLRHLSLARAVICLYNQVE